MKRLILGFTLVVVILSSIVVFRTLMLTPEDRAPVDPEPLPGPEVAELDFGLLGNIIPCCTAGVR